MGKVLSLEVGQQMLFEFASDDFCVRRWRVRLEEFVTNCGVDGAHDIGHLRRVWNNCKKILAPTAGAVDALSLLAMAYLHDLVPVPKDSEQRADASRLSAERASELLASLRFPRDRAERVAEGIISHSYSAHVRPTSVEAKILSDADKLDALGAIGIARLFYTSGSLRSSLFHLTTPIPLERETRERAFALDHVFEKLVMLPTMMWTETARNLAEERLDFVLNFVELLLTEAGYECGNAVQRCAGLRAARGRTLATRAAKQSLAG